MNKTYCKTTIPFFFYAQARSIFFWVSSVSCYCYLQVNMKIIIAPDKFKGSLTSFEACNAIAEGIRTVDVNAEILLFPMADGGDGFATVMQHYLHTATIDCDTVDPLLRKIPGHYQWNETNKTAIIELAVASG